MSFAKLYISVWSQKDVAHIVCYWSYCMPCILHGSSAYRPTTVYYMLHAAHSTVACPISYAILLQTYSSMQPHTAWYCRMYCTACDTATWAKIYSVLFFERKPRGYGENIDFGFSTKLLVEGQRILCLWWYSLLLTVVVNNWHCFMMKGSLFHMPMLYRRNVVHVALEAPITFLMLSVTAEYYSHHNLLQHAWCVLPLMLVYHYVRDNKGTIVDSVGLCMIKYL